MTAVATAVIVTGLFLVTAAAAQQQHAAQSPAFENGGQRLVESNLKKLLLGGL